MEVNTTNTTNTKKADWLFLTIAIIAAILVGFWIVNYTSITTDEIINFYRAI